MKAAASSYLRRLESESIHVLREAAAAFRKPVLLYSAGKDSSVLLHLALKAFHPARPSFPVLHIETGWKFRELIRFRDETVRRHDIDLIVHANQQGVGDGISPIRHGCAHYTRVMKTEALKQALAAHGFDAAIGGGRRDEEQARSIERVFSLRSADQRWDPASQRPELWQIYNTRMAAGESMRVFPLSNWTELDIWTYIHLEEIPIVPLYLAAERPVVERDGHLIMVDDDRLPLDPGETPRLLSVRFRSIGCYPLTGAVESAATTVPAVIEELLATRISERDGRVVDHDAADALEAKKREGYF